MSFCTSTITKTSTFLLKPRRGNRYWKLNSRPRKIQLKPQFRVFPIRRYSPLAAKFSYPFDALVTKVEFCYSLWRLKYLKYVDVDFKVQVPLCVKETFPPCNQLWSLFSTKLQKQEFWSFKENHRSCASVEIWQDRKRKKTWKTRTRDILAMRSERHHRATAAA